MMKETAMRLEHVPPETATAPVTLLGRLGSLEVRLARDRFEVEAAQELRHRVFFEEMGARSPDPGAIGRDVDRFDAFCDHLIVLDAGLPGPDHRRLVGTYRLLRQERAAGCGFYSAGEYEIDALVARNPGKRFLELGRSCVLPAYRSKRTIEALWEAIWAYVNAHGVDVMAGCASFPGVEPQAHAQALAYLARNHMAQGEWRIRATAERYHTMELTPPEAIDPRLAVRQMPPLVKGYLKLGASFGDGCVVDHAFGTVDVFVVLPVGQISRRYLDYYSLDGRTP